MIFRLFGYLAVMLVINGCASVPDRASAPETPLHGEIELTVFGLSCPLCASNLDQQLQRLAGIDEMWPDLDTGAVRLTLKEGYTLTDSDFRRAVRNAGFTMQSVRMVEPQP